MFKGKFYCLIIFSDYFDNVKEILKEKNEKRWIFRVSFSRNSSHRMIINRENLPDSMDLMSSVGFGDEKENIDMGLDLTRLKNLIRIHQQRS